jgi:hypothetical protein
MAHQMYRFYKRKCFVVGVPKQNVLTHIVYYYNSYNCYNYYIDYIGYIGYNNICQIVLQYMRMTKWHHCIITNCNTNPYPSLSTPI